MPLQEEYQITLDTFHGPLDLLLYLIRRTEVDIHDIPIAKITDQYLAFLHQVQEIDIEAAGEFLVMAASLIELKARMLMSQQPVEDDESFGDAVEVLPTDSADPRYELGQQLIAYQRYRMASEDLEARRQEFLHRFPRRPASKDTSPRPVTEPPDLELEDAHSYDLSETYERIMSTIDLDRMGDHRVEIDETPIAVHQEELLEKIRQSPEDRLTLQEAFTNCNAGQRIGLFLAALELVRLRQIVVQQESIEGDIVLMLCDDSV